MKRKILNIIIICYSLWLLWYCLTDCRKEVKYDYGFESKIGIVSGIDTIMDTVLNNGDTVCYLWLEGVCVE